MRIANPLDTIAAISSAAGDSGIGIVRLSGPQALAIADKVFSSKDREKASQYKTHTLHYGWVADGDKIIDEALLTVMRAPRTYTKEDVVEINCHGGIVALRKTLELVLAKGARPAEPGEFTKRAFLNGRIDLAQAEAVLDIIRAKTDAALAISAAQLVGGLSRELFRLRSRLLDILASLEAGIDFPDEETDPASPRKDLEKIQRQIQELLDSSRRARFVREGLHTVICGKPNVGKSSLLNALLQRERSIVTPVAGTTRDTIEEVIDIKGLPLRLVDTAGIIEPRDLVEKKAVARSREQIKLADLVLLVFDASKRLSRQDHLLIKRLKGKRVLPILNKIDLKEKIERTVLLKTFGRIIAISAKKARNINLLEEAIAEVVFQGKGLASEPLLLSNLRHICLVHQAQKLIEEALNSLDNKLPPEFIAQDIREAAACLDAILGKSFSGDLLDRIFSEFCIGK
jgi:tRNA modification GTPase